MSAVEELTALCAALPAEKVAEVLDFARFLETRPPRPVTTAEAEADAAWERILGDPRPRPKLEAYAAAAQAEGPSELMTDEAFEKHMKR